MRYIVVKQDEREIPVIFGSALDYEVLVKAFPVETIIACGECTLQEGFFTCQGFAIISEKEIGSRGARDEILLRSVDYMFGDNTPEELQHFP